MPTKQIAGRVRSKYEFIKANRHAYSVQLMCRALGGAPSRYYAWLLQPLSNRAHEDVRFLQAQPPGNPLESLDIICLTRPSIGLVARVCFRRVSSDIGGHPKEFPYVQFAPGPDRFR